MPKKKSSGKTVLRAAERAKKAAARARRTAFKARAVAVEEARKAKNFAGKASRKARAVVEEEAKAAKRVARTAAKRAVKTTKKEARVLKKRVSRLSRKTGKKERVLEKRISELEKTVKNVPKKTVARKIAVPKRAFRVMPPKALAAKKPTVAIAKPVYAVKAKKPVRRKPLVSVVALAKKMEEHFDRIAGIEKRVSGLEKSLSQSSQQLKLVEARFREHLDELKKIPSMASAEQQEKLSQLEKKFSGLEAEVEDIKGMPLVAPQAALIEAPKTPEEEKASEEKIREISEEYSSKVSSESVPEKSVEQTAHEILSLYFTEIARPSFKRSLNLQDTLDAYHFARKKLREHSTVSAQEIEQELSKRKTETAKSQ